MGKDIPVYYGVLHIFGETGYEGSPFAFQDEKFVTPDGYWDYKGLHILQNGDILEVSDESGNHVWTGIVDIEYESYGGIRGWRDVPRNMPIEDWLKMFDYHHPCKAKLIKRKDWIEGDS